MTSSWVQQGQDRYLEALRSSLILSNNSSTAGGDIWGPRKVDGRHGRLSLLHHAEVMF